MLENPQSAVSTTERFLDAAGAVLYLGGLNSRGEPVTPTPSHSVEGGDIAQACGAQRSGKAGSGAVEVTNEGVGGQPCSLPRMIDQEPRLTSGWSATRPGSGYAGADQDRLAAMRKNAMVLKYQVTSEPVCMDPLRYIQQSSTTTSQPGPAFFDSPTCAKNKQVSA
jgi:hypothetical protein